MDDNSMSFLRYCKVKFLLSTTAPVALCINSVAFDDAGVFTSK